jgi:hypothetical protein
MAGWNCAHKSNYFENAMNLLEIDLGEEGKQYISSWFRGGTGLCSKIPLERGGDVFAPLPAGTPRERALQFKVGGLTSWRETCVWFERHLEQLSDRTGDGSLVFQDVWAKPQDPARGFDGLFFDRSSGVYYVLGAHEINAAAISLTMRRIKSFLLVAVFCKCSFRPADLSSPGILDETLIDEMANNAQEVFVTAYDREGMVVWVRKD